MLVEGSSIRSVCRTLGVSKNTVSRLLVDAGTACAAYHDHRFEEWSPGTSSAMRSGASCTRRRRTRPKPEA